MFDTTYTPALESAASAVGAKADDLRELIEFESSWNPAAYNKSGAVGLIQFMPDILKEMGLLSPLLAAKVQYKAAESEAVKQEVRQEFLLKYPDVPRQLAGPVTQYLKKRGPFPTKQSLYMAVFFPAAKFVPPDTTFLQLYRDNPNLGGESAYYKYFAPQNPGIDTVQSYLDAAKKKTLRLPWYKRLLRPAPSR